MSKIPDSGIGILLHRSIEKKKNKKKKKKQQQQQQQQRNNLIALP